HTRAGGKSRCDRVARKHRIFASATKNNHKSTQNCFGSSKQERASRNLKNHMPERILVTGGAGFVGSSLALAFKRNRSTTTVVVLDNLKRRGSELALERLRAGGVEFAHGDVRVSDDLAAVGPVDLLIEASAEPSVHAGYDGNPSYLIQSNLVGAV